MGRGVPIGGYFAVCCSYTVLFAYKMNVGFGKEKKGAQGDSYRNPVSTLSKDTPSAGSSRAFSWPRR